MSVSFTSYAQDYEYLYYQYNTNAQTNRIEFAEIIEQDGSKEDLYSKAQEWFVDNFNYGNGFLVMENRESVSLIARGVSDMYILTKGRIDIIISYKISIHFKDRKYKYSITNLEINFVDGVDKTTLEEMTIEKLKKPNGKPKNYNAKVKDEVVSTIIDLINSLKQAMQSKHTASIQNWKP